jgi:hypothetical protein
MANRTSIGVVNNSNNGTPNSAIGYVYWSAFSVVWNGVTYAVNAGTTNRKYIYWSFNGGSPSASLSVSNANDDFPTLVAEDWLVIVNSYGLGVDLTMDNVGVFGAAIVPGTIQAGALAVGSVVAKNIVAGSITGACIAANTISAKNMTITDPTNYCSNPNIANNAIDWNSLNSTGMYQVYAAPNLTPYSPKTWVEWSKSGVIGDTTGLEFTANGTTSSGAQLSGTSFKPSTKYVILYSVVSNTMTGNFGLDGSVFGYTALTKTVGNNKVVVTSAASITVNKFYLYTQLPTEILGHKIKIKDLRVLEVPVGSQIEADVNAYNADQLNILYPWISNNAPNATVGHFNTVDNYCGTYVTVTPGDQYWFEMNGSTSNSPYPLNIGMAFFDRNVGYISKVIGAQLLPTLHWSNTLWSSKITVASSIGSTTLTVADASDLIALTSIATSGRNVQGTSILIGTESSMIIAINGNTITIQSPLDSAYPINTPISFVTATEGFLTVPPTAAYAFIWVNIGGSTSLGDWYLSNITVRKMYGGNLIVDGSITAQNMATGTITAQSGVISSLDAATITTGLIQGEQISMSGLVNFTSLSDDLSPLFVQDGSTSYINGATIKAGTISGTSINGLNLTIYNSSQANKESFSVDKDGNAKLTGTVQSYNYSPSDNTGWQIDQGGTATLNKAMIRGSVMLPNAGINNYADPKQIGGNNLLSNSDFSDSTTGWTNANMSVVNNLCTYTAISQYQGAHQNIANPLLYANHVLYFAANVKTDSTNNFLLLNDGTAQITVAHSGSGLFERLTGIMTVASVPTGLYVRVQDNRASGWTQTQVDNFVVCDLTEVYGAGTEPTKAWCDANIDWIPSLVDNANPVRIWAGDTYENRDNAPFRVLQDGTVISTKGIFGGVFSGVVNIGNILITDEDPNQGANGASFLLRSDNNTKNVIQLQEFNGSFINTPFNIGDDTVRHFYVDPTISVAEMTDTKFTISQTGQEQSNTKDIVFPNNAGGHYIEIYNNTFNVDVIDSVMKFQSNSVAATDFVFAKESIDSANMVEVLVDGDLMINKSLTMGYLKAIRKTDVGNTGIDFIFTN